MKAVDKAVFPSLLSKLWLKVKAENAVAGFVGSGLYPINPQKVKPRIVECNAPIQPGNAESPRKLLRQAIINAVTPSPSDSTKSAMANSHRKRKRVQAKAGEVLTDDEVVERLRKEEIARKTKKASAQKAPKKKGTESFQVIASTSCASTPKLPKREIKERNAKRSKLVFHDDNSDSDCVELENEAIDENDSEDEDSVPCLICGKLYGQESYKFRPHWASCDKCGKWTCMQCLPEDFDVEDSFLCCFC